MEEEMELEEGEAYSYHNNDQYGSCMDPDKPDYIDVKLQHVLGHFQKDFEGGVSVENLGAKFGGYGSFLPTYQRSPHSKTSPNIQKKDAQPSPSPSLLEEGRHSSVVTVAASQLQRHGPSTIATTPGSESKRHMKNSTGKEKSMPSFRTVEDENIYESENKKLSHPSDLKTLKVRIKLGSSENLTTQNKAALYSGLGLDSPSSSLEQSPSESEERSCDPQPVGFDSPRSILQVMTSSPLEDGALLLSPLADDLIFFGQKSVMENRTTLAPRNIVGDQKQKSVEKVLLESGGSRSKKPQSDAGGTSRMELDAESLAYDELISNTMRLPIISNANNTTVDMAKVSKKPSNEKEEKANELEAELFNLQPKRKKAGSKSSSLEGPSRGAVKEQRPSSGKKKSKGSQSSGTADNSKDSLNVSSSKSKKRPSEDILRTKNDDADLQPRKVLGKSRDLYSDFFGDIEQEEGNVTEAAEKDTKDTPKNLGLVERPFSTFSNGSKDRLKNKMSEKDCMGANNLSRDLGSASGEKLTDAVAPFFIEENWVQCDKCHQWRLLPIGRNPKSLPDKWLCSMLDWLPGMNQCSFTEEETKEAVLALHQAPVPDFKDSVYLSIKNDGSPEFSVPSKNNIVVDKKRSVDGGSQIPLKGDAVLQLPSRFQNLGSDVQSHKQRPSSYYADESDIKISKVSKKVKNEEYPDEERKSTHRNNVKKVDHSSTRGLPAATEGKSRNFDEHDHVLKHDFLDNTTTEQSRDKVQVSFDSDGRGTSDSGKSASRKRKAKEPQSLQGSLDCVSSPWHQHQSTEVPIRDDEYRKKKKARESKPEGKESTASEGNGRADRRSKKKQNLQHDPGSSQSQQVSDGTNSKKKGSKASGSALAATSSSSKFCKSDKGKVSIQERKVSPGESVSSAPMRNSKHDQLLFGRSKGAGKDDSLDAVPLPFSSPRRSLDGEDYGNNENGTRPYRKSLEASDRDNHAGSTDKEKAVPSIDISRNHPLKFIVDGSDRAAQHPTNLQDSDQRHDGQNGDLHRSGKSEKGSNGEKSRSSKHDHAADKRKVSDPSKDSQEPRDSDGKKLDASRDGKKGSKFSQNAVLKRAHDEEKSSMKGGRGKGQTLPPSGAGQEGLKPKIRIDAKLVGAIEGDDAAKMSGKIGKGAAHQNGKRQQNEKHLSSNGTTQEVSTTSPIRRESLIQLANNALKEAKDLKHMADRAKIAERTGLYFEAALKFLHGAFLLESSYNASLKTSEFARSAATYADTAKLCEFCAYDYEKSKDMASAALAYKCTEVAYFRVVYLSQNNASKDRHELQTVLKMIPPGESPSSVSSVDHVNSSAHTDKANMSKGVNSPQVAGNHIITARNRVNFERLLDFAQNANNAMEASRKSRAAFDSAIGKSKEIQLKDTISSIIRRALDYNFQDVEGLLLLVRQATEVISR